MPELPEVETIRRGLSKYIVKKKIVGIDVLCEKSFIGELVKGRVLEIRRFGKALVVDVEGGVSLLIHLRMTGQLIYRSRLDNRGGLRDTEGNCGSGDEGDCGFAGGHPSENFVDELPNKQTRVVIDFGEGVLYFNDQRKFGFIKVIKTSEVEKDAFIRKLAPEPWNMTAEELHGRLQRHRNSVIKAVILDQTVICGLGNIYADEALFAAGIYPGRRAGTVSFAETERLIDAAREVMEKSIAAGGSTMETYVKADGTRGDYLELFAQVFHRQGKPCMRCGTEIVKTRVAGRGTHYCPVCQRIDGRECGGEDYVGAYEISEKTGVDDGGQHKNGGNR